MDWLDRHVRHIAVAVGCVACVLVGMAIGLSVGGHSVLPVLYHDAPHTVTKTIHGRTRTVTKRGKVQAAPAAPHTVTDTVPTTITVTRTQPPSTVTSTITATETTPPTTTTPGGSS